MSSTNELTNSETESTSSNSSPPPPSTTKRKLSYKKESTDPTPKLPKTIRENNNNNTSTSSLLVNGSKHPVYTGVRMRSWGKWVSEIREPKKKSRIWLGTFANPEMAARAHDVAALCIKGKTAILNFPHLMDQLPRPVTCASRDVQAAALKAAEMNHLDPSSLPPPEELEELFELPSLGRSYESTNEEFVYTDTDQGWLYSPPWLPNFQDFEFPDEMAGGEILMSENTGTSTSSSSSSSYIPTIFDTLLWQY